MLTGIARPVVWVVAAVWLALEGGWRIASRVMRAYDAGLSALGRFTLRYLRVIVAALAPARTTMKSVAAAVSRLYRRLVTCQGGGSGLLARPLRRCTRFVRVLCRPLVQGLRRTAGALTVAATALRSVAGLINRTSTRLGAVVRNGWLWFRRLVGPTAAATRRAVAAVLWRPVTRLWALVTTGVTALAMPFASFGRWLRARARPMGQWCRSRLRRMTSSVARWASVASGALLAIGRRIGGRLRLAYVRGKAAASRLRRASLELGLLSYPAAKRPRQTDGPSVSVGRRTRKVRLRAGEAGAEPDAFG